MVLLLQLIVRLLRLLLGSRADSIVSGLAQQPLTPIHKYALPEAPKALLVEGTPTGDFKVLVADMLEGSALFPPAIRLEQVEGGMILGVVTGSAAPDDSGTQPWETFGRVLSSHEGIARVYLASTGPSGAHVASVYENGLIARQLSATDATWPKLLRQALTGPFAGNAKPTGST
ncbi:MAG: hypothetical protein ACJ790_09370 [Myxococcaceae bacterium]